jgi:hypothetical protein
MFVRVNRWKKEVARFVEAEGGGLSVTGTIDDHFTSKRLNINAFFPVCNARPSANVRKQSFNHQCSETRVVLV